MKNLKTVTAFTISEMVRRKSFIISTLVILIIIALAFNIPNIMKKLGNDGSGEKVLIIDPENLFEGMASNLNEAGLGYEFQTTTEELNLEEIKEKIKNDIDACIKFSKQENTVKMEYIVESAAVNYGEVPQTLVATFTNLYSNLQVKKLNLSPEELSILEPEFDVTLTETDEHKRDDNTTGKDYSNVKPGDVLSKDPTVNLKSDSEDAYVRVRIDYKGLTDEQAADIEEALDIQKGWVKSDDGYYYYQNILSNKNDGETSSKVFTKVTIPAEWGNEMADKTFNIDARAEFIQADNFTPVKDAYGNITGWGNADIK